MIQRESVIPDRHLINAVRDILHCINEAGGDRCQWLCETSTDAEEAVAERRHMILGTPLISRFTSYESTLQVKLALREAGLQTLTESRSRGGPEL